MLIRDEAIKHIKRAIPHLGEGRWMKDEYTKAYHDFVRENGMCSTRDFDVAVAQSKRLASGSHNYRSMGRHGKYELTHTTMMRSDMDKTASNAYIEALRREGHNVS